MASALSGASNGERSRRLLSVDLSTCAAIGVALLPLAPYGVQVLAHSSHDPLLGGDQAVLEMWTRSASEGEALLGPYSRYHWNHPGPLIFYWWAGFAGLLGVSPFALSVGALAIALASVAVILLSVRRASGIEGLWCAAAVVLYFFARAGYDWIDDPWNPIVVILPIAALGTVAAVVIAGHRWGLPIAAILASLAVQTHVGTGPVVAGIVVALIVGIAAGGHVSCCRVWLGPVALSVALTSLIWAPPAYEELSRQPGNITQLRNFERTSEADQKIADIWDLAAPQISLGNTELVQAALGRGGRSISSPGLLSNAYAVILIGAVSSMAARNRQKWRFESALCVVSLLALVGLIWGLKSVVGALEGYLSLSALAVGLLLHLSLALNARRWFSDILRSRDGRISNQMWSRARSLLRLFSVGFAVVAFGVVAMTSHPYLYNARKDDVPVSDVERIQDAVILNSSEVILFIDDASAWPQAALIANQLEKKGVWVAVPPEYEFLFGDQRRATGCENMAVRVDLDLERGDLSLGSAAATLVKRAPGRSCQ